MDVLTCGADDFLDLRLGDGRLERRMYSATKQLSAQPANSLPEAMGSDAATEGLYRLMSNDDVEPVTLITHATGQAWKRAQRHNPVALALHDTTEFSFPGEGVRDGLSRIGTKQGFWGHTALLVAEQGPPLVHGVVGFRPYTKEDGKWYPAGDPTPLDVGTARWLDLVQRVDWERSAEVEVVHVMDREGDMYDLLAELVATSTSFVVRSQHDRAIDGAVEAKVSPLVARQAVVATREVILSRRSQKGRPPQVEKCHPSRDMREARLEVRFCEVELVAPPATRTVGAPTSRVHVVDVVEVGTPEGCEAVHWRLLTSLPVGSASDALRVVDIYRRRWLIEEFFKAIKTGCAYEKRQLESLDKLLVLLAMTLPIAVGLLNLRAIARSAPDAPASLVVNDVQEQVLRKLSTKKLPKKAAARDVMLAVAGLGGHLKANGDPGWLVLGRGWQKLLILETGWRAAMEMMADGRSRSRGADQEEM